MFSLLSLLVAAACSIAPVVAGPPSNDTPFPASLSDCGGQYITEVNNSLNHYRCSNWNDGIGANDDQKLILFDAYYNGSLNLNFIPIGAETRKPYLETINASLAIGQMNLPNNSQISRSKWDANNFFMEIDSFPPKCDYQTQTCAPYIHATSSSSYWYWSQAWALSDTKNGDGYDISGNVTKTKAMSGSQGTYFAFPSDSTHGIHSYELGDFTMPRDVVTMTGHISPTDANVTFTISNYHSGSSAPFATLQFVFSGKAWKDGARLVTSGDHPTTTGQAKAVSQGGKSTSTSIPKPLSTIIGAAAGGGILILLIIIGLVFCCCLGTVMSCFRRNKAQSQMNQQWQQQQQQAPPVVQYPAADQYTAPSPPAVQHQYGAPPSSYPQGQPPSYPVTYAPQAAAYHPPTGNPQY